MAISGPSDTVDLTNQDLLEQVPDFLTHIAEATELLSQRIDAEGLDWPREKALRAVAAVDQAYAALNGFD
jgi:hypothetical protein